VTIAALSADPRRLGALWFGIQVVWTAVLGVVLQERATALGPDAIGVFSNVAAGGALIGAAVQVAAGFLSDRVRARTGDRRLFYAAGVALAVPAIAILPSAPTIGWVWFDVVLLQIGMNIAGGPYQGIVGDYIEPDRTGRASSWMSVHQFSGSVVGLVLTILLHGLALGIALAACLAAGWWVTHAHAGRLCGTTRATAPLRIDRDMWTVLISRALINVGFYTLFYFLFFFVRESLGVTGAQTTITTGILILAFTLAGVAGAALAGGPVDRYDKRVVVSIACAAIAVAVGAFAAAPNFTVALACAIGSGAAWGAFLTADWAIAYAVLPGAALASAMGVWNLAAALPQVAAPKITAPLVSYFDARSAGLGPRVALICVIVEFALGTAWLWRLKSLRPRGSAGGS
jgi:MFS family permease